MTAVLKDLQNRNFQVAGHTDNIPIKSAKFRSNWDLSTARAVEVVNFMIVAGMEPKRLSAAGYAAESPVAPNDTPENKAKNRRIEITLVPNLDDLPPIDEALKDAPRRLDPGGDARQDLTHRLAEHAADLGREALGAVDVDDERRLDDERRAAAALGLEEHARRRLVGVRVNEAQARGREVARPQRGAELERRARPGRSRRRGRPGGRRAPRRRPSRRA